MASSSKETAWIAPMRHEMLDVYKRVCSTIARYIDPITIFAMQELTSSKW